jgi:hypothetical protein
METERHIQPQFNLKHACTRRWEHVVVNLQQRSGTMCCKTPRRQFTREEITHHGADIFANHSAYQERRQEMLHGLQHTDCNMCWKIEKSGMRSVRVNVDYISQIEKLTEPPALNFSKYPNMLDIELSNLCDAKCIYCNSLFSSRWQNDRSRETFDYDRVPEKLPSSEQLEFENLFWQWFDKASEHLNYIAVIGGEPLINAKYYEILERIAGNKKINPENFVLTTISNFNTPPKFFERFLQYAPRITERYRFNLDASMDAFGTRGAYIRDGVDWDRWVGNVRQLLGLKLPNFEMGFQIAINLLTLSTLPQLVDLIINLQSEFGISCLIKPSVVTYPRHLSPYVLTPDYAEYLFAAADKLEKNHNPNMNGKFLNFSASNWDGYARFLREMGEAIISGQPDTIERKKFAEWVASSDLTREQKFLQIFPEYEHFLSKCGEPPQIEVKT